MCVQYVCGWSVMRWSVPARLCLGHSVGIVCLGSSCAACLYGSAVAQKCYGMSMRNHTLNYPFLSDRLHFLSSHPLSWRCEQGLSSTLMAKLLQYVQDAPHTQLSKPSVSNSLCLKQRYRNSQNSLSQTLTSSTDVPAIRNQSQPYSEDLE